MVENSELLKVQAFEDLPDDQITWFISQSEELVLKPGEIYSRQGDPADWMAVVISGQLEANGDIGGETVIFPIPGGNVTGVLPFSRMKQMTVGVRATLESRLLRFPAARFPELMQRMPELTKRLVGLMSDRIRETTRIEQQRDRLAALGKLSAGLAHELNNPAAAAKRSASQLRGTINRVREASHELGRHELTGPQRTELDTLERSILNAKGPPPNALTISALEDEIDTLLRSHGLEDMWQLAADLARRCVQPQAIENLFGALDPDTARAALVRISAAVEIFGLIDEIESSTTRISDLVRAIKEYTFMDQAPLQNVDIVKSIETTLIILNHKLKHGVEVQRDYEKIPLMVNSFGSELSQVWTNIIDNAIDAMGGKGELRIHVYRQDDHVVVEIGDNGPGIPEDIEAHMFEPFFTTKKVGEGTGLGLDTVQRIVRKHHGSVQVNSVPGDTRFQVWLPIARAAG